MSIKFVMPLFKEIKNLKLRMGICHLETQIRIAQKAPQKKMSVLQKHSGDKLSEEHFKATISSYTTPNGYYKTRAQSWGTIRPYGTSTKSSNSNSNRNRISHQGQALLE